ncbi:fumarylacetoacetate hydrolase family protein [Paracoccaceae bacterium GXU_MW_L88]
MKLLRIGPKGEEKPAILDREGRARDLSGHVADFAGKGISLEAIAAIREITIADLPVIEGRVGACLADAPNFFAIGLNYRAHAEETGSRLPKDPMIFNKATSCIAGPYDDLMLAGDQTDWEVELGVVIGAPLFRASEEEAMAAISGYCLVNDVSERNFQKNFSGQFVKGKSAPGYGPIGPWLVTPDEVGDPQALNLRTSVNGEVQQDSSTADMIFSVREIVTRLAFYFELRPGDIIATGTPSGVGLGQNPPRFLQSGDEMELEVAGLGIQQTKVL